MGFNALRSGMMVLLLIFLYGCAGHSAFTQAVIDRNDAFIDTYLAEGNDVDEPDGFGITALYQAVSQGDSYLSQKLLDAGADPNAVVGELGNRPLMAAVRASQNNAQLTSLLISAGADPNVADIYGFSPLKIAVGDDRPDVARLLIDAGADVNELTGDATPLMIAAQSKYSDMVRLLLARGADVSIKRETTKKQYTALYYAVELRGWEAAEALYPRMVNRDAPGVPRTREFMEQQQQVIVDMLLSAGADPNGVSSDNEHTILTLAVSNPAEPSLIETLLLAGADPNMPKGNGMYPLYISTGVEEDTTERTEILLSYGADVDARNGKEKWTALFYAVQYNRLAALKVLLAAGADASIGSAKGYTPVYQAAFKGHDEAFDYLLASGVDVNTVNGANGWTPLHAASDKGQIDIARKLIAAGADVNKRSKEGYTAIYFAAKSEVETKPIVEMLIAVGADVNSRNNGYYAVHMAANGGYYEIVQLLLEAGANPNLQDKDGDTALDHRDGQGLPENHRLSPAIWRSCEQLQEGQFGGVVRQNFRNCGHRRDCGGCRHSNGKFARCNECSCQGYLGR
ncbi:ankyrin repeat protein [Litorivivens lipolytica]|uniref:Ankyrin repeat protein n=1 Tax=Litorivivens lipolytica TaxID=1524264 RepID=A0A7W4W1U6_9GAMM|nr:ankyrin repeat domain-containing protein [Litorivivens lipolytica]MBB3045911.1 ankyrin repeat protein [Litorivivens lipolytica]